MSHSPIDAQSLATLASDRWDAPFLIEGRSGEIWSFGATLSAAADLADRLADAGVVPGDRLAIFLPNGVPFVSVYLACLLGGFVAVPLHGQLAEADGRFILETVRPRFLLSEDEVPFGRSEDGLFRPLVKRVKDRKSSLPGRLAGLDLDRLFTVHFTSGTTGRPKGVCHSPGTLLRSANAFNEALEFGPTHRFFHVLPMAYMAGFLNTLLCPFLAGGSVVVGAAYHAGMALDFWSLPRRYEANVLWIVPTMAAALLAVDKDSEGAAYCRRFIQRVCVGTAPLPPDVARRFLEKYGVRLLESYGLSETLFVASNAPAFEEKNGSVGRLLDGVTVRVCDEAGTTLPRGSEGEIWIESDSTTSGYFGETTPSITNGGFCSGDLGFVDADNDLFITGRRKDLIIRGGINVSPRAIEEAILLRADQVQSVAVVGISHPLKGEEIVAFVQPAASGEGVAAVVQQHCRETLAPHQCPDRVLLVESMPVGVSGKIQKHKLRETLLGTRSLAGA